MSIARYDKEAIFETCKKVVEENRLFFIEDIIAFLPITKPTFYVYFPVDSYEFNTLKDMINKNKVLTKTEMRSKWYLSENPTLQIALYKTICSDDERKMLSTNHTDITTGGDKINSIPKIVFVDDDFEEETESDSIVDE